jgi:hypothetical protein
MNATNAKPSDIYKKHGIRFENRGEILNTKNASKPYMLNTEKRE